MNYKIALSWDNKYQPTPAHRAGFIVVGTGGTGSFVADGLARMLPQSHNLTLIDMDTVEEQNLSRQMFTEADIGRLKSEVLAKRLCEKYRRPIKYSTLPFGDHNKGERRNIIIGCVDRGTSRQAIADNIGRGQFWIDSGNGDNYGQILIGNVKMEDSYPSFLNDMCIRLPLPSIQQPAILAQVPRRRSCTEAVIQEEQSPTINQVMAALVLEVVRRLLDNSCPWMQLLIDMEVGTVTPVMAEPEIVSRMTGLKLRKLKKEV